MNANTAWIIGLIASVFTAVAGVANTFPDPYNRIMALMGVIGTAISGYMAQPRRRAWGDDEREAKTGIKQPDPEPPKAA